MSIGEVCGRVRAGVGEAESALLDTEFMRVLFCGVKPDGLRLVALDGLGGSGGGVSRDGRPVGGRVESCSTKAKTLEVSSCMALSNQLCIH